MARSRSGHGHGAQYSIVIPPVIFTYLGPCNSGVELGKLRAVLCHGAEGALASQCKRDVDVFGARGKGQDVASAGRGWRHARQALERRDFDRPLHYLPVLCKCHEYGQDRRLPVAMTEDIGEETQRGVGLTDCKEGPVQYKLFSRHPFHPIHTNMTTNHRTHYTANAHDKISEIRISLAPLDQLGPGRPWGLAGSITGRDLDQHMMRVGLYRARPGLAKGSWISAARGGGRHPPHPRRDGSDQLPPHHTRQHAAQPLLAGMNES